jgi:hypothetical protein
MYIRTYIYRLDLYSVLTSIVLNGLGLLSKAFVAADISSSIYGMRDG